MTKYMKMHEKYILDKIKNSAVNEQILDYHRVQIEHMKHERLVHLIVMSLFALMIMISVTVYIFQPILLMGMLFILLSATECFYILHYFRLENTVQRWYKIENTMIRILNDIGTNCVDGICEIRENS